VCECTVLDGLDLLGLDLDIFALGNLIARLLSSLFTTSPVFSSTICWRSLLLVLRLIWWKWVFSARLEAG
jgi:hypothetical protein